MASDTIGNAPYMRLMCPAAAFRTTPEIDTNKARQAKTVRDERMKQKVSDQAMSAIDR